MDTSANHPNETASTLAQTPDGLDKSNSDKITDWVQEPTITDIKADLEFSRQANTDQKANVEGWLNLRNTTGSESGKKTKKPGRSSVQPKLIRKHNEWRYPGLSEPFLNTERMYNITGRTHADTAAARQNQIVLNWQFDTKLSKVAFIDKYVRRTVDEGSCIIRIGWKRETEKVKVQKPVYDYYPLDDPEADAEALAILAQASQMFLEDQEKFQASSELPETLKASVEYSMENKVPVHAKQNGTQEITVSKITANCPTLKIINVANFFMDPSCDGDWTKAQFMIHTYESTQSDLKKRGIFENLDKVNWQSAMITSNLGTQDHQSSSPQIDSRLVTDKSKILIYEYWGLSDIHKDGVMVPIVVTFVGDTIIQMEENPFPDRKPPFIIVPYMPIDGSAYGEADASIMQDNQRILGAVTRGMIDLLGRSSNAQTGFAKGALDAVNRKRVNMGEDFEFNPNTNPEISIRQLTYPDIPNSAMQMSMAQHQEAEGLTGVKGFSSGLTGDSYGNVARGITSAVDAAGQREMSILRRLAEGMRQIGIKIQSMNVKFLEKVEVIRITDDEFVEINREDLAGSFDFLVDISTAQVDERKSQDLGYMLQTQGPNMDPGLEQVILSKIADLKRMPDLAEQIRNYQPQPDPLQEELKKLEIEKLQAEIDLDRAKAERERAIARSETVDTDLEESGLRHERSIEGQGAQARGNRDHEVTKALLSGETAAGNIEASVGFNKLVEDADRLQARSNVAPLAPLQSAQASQEEFEPGVALPV